MIARIDKEGYYSPQERDLLIKYHKGNVPITDIPFNMLPMVQQECIISRLNALFPEWCTNCNAVDESDFIVPGVKMCHHCSYLLGSVDPAALPSIDSIKYKILSLANGGINIIQEAKEKINFITDSTMLWIQYWRLYLHLRS